MALIKNSRANKYARPTPGEEPTEHLESLGDCLIKELSEKQLDTELTLQKQFIQEKQFIKGAGHVSLSSFLPGTSTLDDFQQRTKDAEMLQTIASCGLKINEAERYIKGQDILYADKAECSAKKSQQDYVSKCLKKVEEEDTNQDANIMRLSRQEQELGLIIKPNSTETKLLKFAMSCRKTVQVDSRPTTHPINKLHDIEKNLFKEHADPIILAKTIRRKRRQMLEAELPSQHVRTKPPIEGSSLWDITDKPKAISSKPSIKTKMYGCTKERLYTVKNGKIVEIVQEKKMTCNKMKIDESSGGKPFVTTGNANEKDLNNLSFVKLSESEIREIPKFKNYNRGQVNKVLFLKNISRNVKEDDLVDVFQKFEDPQGPKIIYRFMNGKMRGQAFITFPNSNQAAKALDEVNGLILKGKPLIIQFGRDKNG